MSTNFLWTPGTSNNGLLTASPVKLIGGATLNGVAGAGSGLAVSNGTGDDSPGGTGIFNNSNFSQGVWAEIIALFDAITSPGAGANVCGWFLKSWDGTTFESASIAPPRPADFSIALPSATSAAGQQFCVSGLVLIPALKFKVLIQNNAANALAANANNVIRAVPVAMAAV